MKIICSFILMCILVFMITFIIKQANLNKLLIKSVSTNQDAVKVCIKWIKQLQEMDKTFYNEGDGVYRLISYEKET